MHDIAARRWSGEPASVRRSPPRCGRCPAGRAASWRSRASPGSASRACSLTSPRCAAADRGHGARRARVGVRERPPVRAVDRGAGPPPGRRGRAPVARMGLADPGALGAAAALAGVARLPATGTARTERCGTCSSASRRRARWSSGWTTCTGPIPHRSTPWPPWCAGRPPAPVLFAVAAREGQLPADAGARARRRAARGSCRRAAAGAAERGRGGGARRRRGRSDLPPQRRQPVLPRAARARARRAARALPP